MSAAIDTKPGSRLDAQDRTCGEPSIPAARPSGSRWFVVASQAKAERRAHASLHRFGYQPYLPLITVRWRDRSWHTQALFPGYLFVHIQPGKSWYPIRYAPGVFGLVSIEGKPTPCPEGAVEALQASEVVRATCLRFGPQWAPGMPCSLAAGAFEGCPAVVLKVGQDMALVSLLMFGELREVAVQLDCLVARDE